ncbi:MAG: FGGY-family carbohydrate kinase [Bilifractor sp.]|jgi:xylulokinase
MVIGGLDIGTTGCKLTVFDETGSCLVQAYRDYPVSRGQDESTVDAGALWLSVSEVISEIAERYPDLAGIGITSFGESFVMIDENDRPLAPVMLYTDPRGKKERETLEEKLGSRHIMEISGLRPHEMYSLPKLIWMKDHEPEVFARAKHVFLMGDFVAYMLTHEKKIDYSLATRTMAFDIRNCRWSEEIFGAAGIDPSLFSEPVPDGTAVGRVRPEVSAKTGLRPWTQIIIGCHDQVAAATGAGVFSEELAVDGAGTVECLTPVFKEIPPMDARYDGNYAVVPYVVPGTYVCYAFSYTGGALMQWCTETLAKKEKELAKQKGISVNEWLEQAWIRRNGNEPSGMLVLPHFAGAATPYMDTGSKGAVIGLTMGTRVEDIYRACMEGVVYEMHLNEEHLALARPKYKKLIATGGGAHSEVWMQMKADVLNRPITALETVNAGTVGCAMLTGVALGIWSSPEEAAKTMVHEVKTYEPDAGMHEKYMKIYERYRQLYDAVRPLV